MSHIMGRHGKDKWENDYLWPWGSDEDYRWWISHDGGIFSNFGLESAKANFEQKKRG